MSKKEFDYSLKPQSGGEYPAPEVNYQPPRPKNYNPPIGLIGCGGITQTHLAAYKQQGFNVVALCDHTKARAAERASEHYPQAQIFSDHHQLLEREDIEVVDIATHP